MGPVRLNAYLARAGVASRRGADELIKAGRVTVNGSRGELNTFVEAADAVLVDGREVGRQALRHVLLNKPRGTITTARDPGGRPTVVDLVKGDVRVVPVGRLDRDTTGVLLLTNDGPLAHRLAHPRYGIEKAYVADVRGEPTTRRSRGSHRASSSMTAGRRRRGSAGSAPHGSSSSSTRAGTARCAACWRRSATRSSGCGARATRGWGLAD